MVDENLNPVLVTGATGRVGRLVVDRIAGRGRAGARAHAPAGSGGVAGGRRGRRGRPHRARIARRRRCKVSAPCSSSGPRRRPPLRAVVERLAAHTRRVVFLSSPHQTPHPFFQQPNPMAALHADIERLIAAAGLDVDDHPAGDVRVERAVLVGGRRSETATSSGGRTARPRRHRSTSATSRPWRRARCLEDGHAGGDYVLTGPESLSQAEQVSIIGDAIGRPIRFEELSPEEFRRETAGRWPASGRGHAARRVGGGDRAAGVRDLHRGRHRRIAGAHLSPVGRRSRRRVSVTPICHEGSGVTKQSSSSFLRGFAVFVASSGL